MKEFEYYRLLLERLENQSPLDGPKEYEMMKVQADLIQRGVMKWMANDPLAAIAKQNELKMYCCVELRKAILLSADDISFEDTVPINVSITWNMVLMALVKTLEDLYVFLIHYTGIRLGEFEQSDWESKNELVN